MTKKQGGESIVLFENDSVRRVWVEQEEKWYFSVVDVCRILTDSLDAGAYWRKLKQRLIEENIQPVTKCHGLDKKNKDFQSVTNCNRLNEEYDFQLMTNFHQLNEENIQLSTICRQLKLLAPDGKMRATDCANTEGLLRIIQSIPSPKVEAFKRWLVKVGYERIQEIENNELKFHIKSGDYFGNLATSFSIIKQTLGIKNFLYLNKKTLNKLEKDLIFMQNNYKIIKK